MVIKAHSKVESRRSDGRLPTLENPLAGASWECVSSPWETCLSYLSLHNIEAYSAITAFSICRRTHPCTECCPIGNLGIHRSSRIIFKQSKVEIRSYLHLCDYYYDHFYFEACLNVSPNSEIMRSALLSHNLWLKYVLIRCVMFWMTWLQVFQLQKSFDITSKSL